MRPFRAGCLGSRRSRLPCVLRTGDDPYCAWRDRQCVLRAAVSFDPFRSNEFAVGEKRIVMLYPAQYSARALPQQPGSILPAEKARASPPSGKRRLWRSWRGRRPPSYVRTSNKIVLLNLCNPYMSRCRHDMPAVVPVSIEPDAKPPYAMTEVGRLGWMYGCLRPRVNRILGEHFEITELSPQTRTAPTCPGPSWSGTIEGPDQLDIWTEYVQGGSYFRHTHTTIH
jgi:hypothetical protein